MDYSILIPLAFPGVVNVEIDVPGAFESGRDQRIGGFANSLVINFVREMVPAVPSHWRRGREFVLGGSCQSADKNKTDVHECSERIHVGVSVCRDGVSIRYAWT